LIENKLANAQKTKLRLFFWFLMLYLITMDTPPLELTYDLPRIAPCEHIAGNEKFIRKAFILQASHLTLSGSSLMDITLDLEDGAPVGDEEAARQLFVTLLTSPENKLKQAGVRIHPPESTDFARDLEVIIEGAGSEVAYITIPKVRTAREVRWTLGVIRYHLEKRGLRRTIPLHLLIETPEALSCLRELAAIEEVQTLDFGLMDFISHLGGAIPSHCMRSPEQFDHNLLRKVKEEIALTALCANKIPSHNVTVDVRRPDQAFQDAHRARTEFGFLRMWSIHPEQIERIIHAMSPGKVEVAEAREILAAAKAKQWGPIEHNGRLHDRASYRYYWGILSRSGEQVS
jgi:citrate lyase subunit beta/citryl-CoA lyase